ncbi:helix-turn-helix domain-containing protein, partial [Porticoccus sp.]|uniref:helix-turn-helix domain-containing protein n=1 Tax=Porticoccus sp. TaxID=2024853 RepID=UPI003F6A225C
HLSNNALATLQKYPFPGNIRELENTLERAFTLCDNKLIDAENLALPDFLSEKKVRHQEGGDFVSAGFDSLDDYLAEVEKQIILSALEQNRWNKTATAEKLGISFRQIRHKLKKYGID